MLYVRFVTAATNGSHSKKAWLGAPNKTEPGEPGSVVVFGSNRVISANRYSDREPTAADDPIRRTVRNASHSGAGRPIRSGDRTSIHNVAAVGGPSSVGNFPTG